MGHALHLGNRDVHESELAELCQRYYVLEQR